MKEKRGISLIVLVVTIIVMIIISGAIIITLTQTNIIDQAEEATFKSQVRTIEEALNLKKASLLISSGGDIPQYNLTLGNLGIDPSLESQFDEKLFINSNGELFYQENKFTAQEVAWLRQLGLKSGLGSATGENFVADVGLLYNASKTNGYNNTVDHYTIIDEIQRLYPGTVIFAEAETGAPAPKEFYYDIIKFLYREEQLVETLSALTEIEKNEAPVKADVREALGYNDESMYNIKYITDKHLEATTVSALIENLENHLNENKASINAGVKFIVVNGEDKMLITDSGTSTYNWPEGMIMLNAEESAKYTYETTNTYFVKITGYTGDRSRILVPYMLTKENGDVLFVTTIAEGAFANTKPMRMEMTSTVLEKAAQINMGKSYDSLTMAESKAFVDAMGGNSSGTYTDDRAGKNKLFATNFIPMFKASADVTEENAVEYVGEGNEQLLYGVVKILDKQFTPQFFKLTDEHVDAVESMIISEGITILEKSIASGNYIGEIYLPSTLEDVNEDALLDSNVGKVKTPLTWEEIQAFCEISQETVLGSDCRQDYFETVSN